MTQWSSRGLYVLCLALLQPCTNLSYSIALWLKRWWRLYDGPCPNLLWGDRVLIFVPLWLLVGAPSAIIPELAFSRAEHSRPYSDVAKYIFDIYYLLIMLFVYCFLWPLRVVWLLVCCLYKEVYLQVFKCVSFWSHGCCGEWEGGPVNQVHHTSWVAVVTPTDRPKSVRNCCLIEFFCGVVCDVTLPFWTFSVGVGFCHRTGSDLLLFVFIRRFTVLFCDNDKFRVFEFHISMCLSNIKCVCSWYIHTYYESWTFHICNIVHDYRCAAIRNLQLEGPL